MFKTVSKTTKKFKSSLPRSAYQKNADFYKILSNAKRLEILNLLRQQEMSVEELISIIGISKANMSQHLALLRHCHIVTVHRKGQKAYYNIADPRIVRACRIMYELSIK